MFFASDKKLNAMSDDALMETRARYAKVSRAGSKIASPLSFFGLLTAGVGLPFLIPVLPQAFFFLLLISGAALASMSLNYIGDSVKHRVDTLMDVRHPERVASRATKAQDAQQSAVNLLPDLSEVFSRGVANPSTMKPLQLRPRTPEPSFAKLS